jgi:ArsR family transcriptional regulator, arsenate/arsenite/antimonite-responsive transcriptional repressor
MDIYQARADVAKALAHPARMAIIDILSRGEQCVTDLTCVLELSQPTVSKHLAVLRSAGLLDCTKVGNQVTYRIRTPCMAELFRCLDRILMEDFEKRRRQLCRETEDES